MFQTENGLILTEEEKHELRKKSASEGTIEAMDWLWQKAVESGLKNVSMIDCSIITLNETEVMRNGG